MKRDEVALSVVSSERRNGREGRVRLLRLSERLLGRVLALAAPRVALLALNDAVEVDEGEGVEGVVADQLLLDERADDALQLPYFHGVQLGGLHQALVGGEEGVGGGRQGGGGGVEEACLLDEELDNGSKSAFLGLLIVVWRMHGGVLILVRGGVCEMIHGGEVKSREKGKLKLAMRRRLLEVQDG